jgi:hypothetical protein
MRGSVKIIGCVLGGFIGYSIEDLTGLTVGVLIGTFAALVISITAVAWAFLFLEHPDTKRHTNRCCLNAEGAYDRWREVYLDTPRGLKPDGFSGYAHGNPSR